MQTFTARFRRPHQSQGQPVVVNAREHGKYRAFKLYPALIRHGFGNNSDGKSRIGGVPDKGGFNVPSIRGLNRGFSGGGDPSHGCQDYRREDAGFGEDFRTG